MNILLVNDDGYNAEGILLLQKKLKKYGEVTIVAPKNSMSAKSCSLTIRTGLKVVEESENVYSVEGFPADCTSFGLVELNKHFDLVVSGCNHGLNISDDINYSGTIGACVESIKHKVPAIAFSCEFNFNIVNKYFDKVMNYIIENQLISSKYILNINFPKGNYVKDIKLTKSISTEYDRAYYKHEDGLYYCQRLEICKEIPIDSENYAVNNEIISICPLTNSYFNSNLYDNLIKKI